MGWAPWTGQGDDPWVILRSVLADCARGPLDEAMAPVILDLLRRLWPDDVETAMTANKLSRWEQPTWSPPTLNFDIERHGATVMGSSRAEVQRWAIDVDNETVHFAHTRRRQLGALAPRLDVNSLAKRCAALIIHHMADSWLKWSSANEVKVDIALIIPETNKQTTIDRRKRFRKALADELVGTGWESPRPNVWVYEQR